MVNFFYKAWCRCFQAGIKTANCFLRYPVPELISGPGSIMKLPDILKEEGFDRILIVTGASLLKRGLLAPLFSGMDELNIAYTVFSPSATDPTCADVENGYTAFKANRCSAIVAVGGGSRIDCAKGIAAKAARPGRPVKSLQGMLKVRKAIVPLYAVPTTAGAGSETTVAAVIVDEENHHKASINDPVLVPRAAILDPVLTVGLPSSVTAYTGMDALTHAVEAYLNHYYTNADENRMALDAIRHICDSLLKACRNGGDLKAREEMQLGAFLAGRAFTKGCVGYVHALGHTLGGLYRVPHGLAMAVILPHALRQYGDKIIPGLSEIADACGISGAGQQEKAENFIRWIEDANRQMGIPEKFDMIRQEDIEQMITWAIKEANPLYPVPVIWGREDFRKLIRSIAE